MTGMLPCWKGKNPVPTVFEQFSTEFLEDLEKKRTHPARNSKFQFLITFVVLLNTFLIGIETDNTRTRNLQDRLVFFSFEFFFGIVFFVEMVLKLQQLGWDYFADGWNIYDYSLVALGTSDIVVSLTDPDSGGMRIAAMLRIFRFARVVRAMKGLSEAKGLWVIIQGLLDSSITVFWVASLLVVFCYCFGVGLVSTAAFEVKTKQLWVESDIYIGTTLRGMLTVLQVITFDCWSERIARPLFAVSDGASALLLAAIIVLSFGVLNILVAVMVERLTGMTSESIAAASKAKESSEKLLYQHIQEDLEAHCRESDPDGLELTFKEFKTVLKTDRVSSKLKLLGVTWEASENLFEIMDVDQSGTVTPKEFVEGLQKVKGEAKGNDLVTLIGFTQKQCFTAKDFVDRLSVLSEKADTIQERLLFIGANLDKELLRRQDAEKRNVETWSGAAKRSMVITKWARKARVFYPGLKQRKNLYDDDDDY
eukprot:TRINITY_DN36990_c0_g1_i1.p1 TRINITY_DN36990_c0_g1~~TRINITY_DN36990_c0_g1_i1.p1  ORF type:complete len:480 (-),score=83.35 TRINITY_DN36990_c0_g1_i1:87-1526(-)